MGAHPSRIGAPPYPPPGQSGKAIGRPGREAVGEVFLVSRQNVDAVVARPTEALQEIGRYREAPEDQGGCRRRRQNEFTVRPTGCPSGLRGRDHGHAGGETAQSTPKARQSSPAEPDAESQVRPAGPVQSSESCGIVGNPLKGAYYPASGRFLSRQRVSSSSRASPKSDRLADAPRPPRFALAGHAGSLSHLAFRGHAAADPGRDGDSYHLRFLERFPDVAVWLPPLPGGRGRLGRAPHTTAGRITSIAAPARS